MAATNNNTTIKVLVEPKKLMAALLLALLAKMDNIGITRVHPVPGSIAMPRTALAKVQKLDCYNPLGYCWSHGYMVHKCHTNATCKNKKEGTKMEETCANTMEGKQNKKV